MEMIPWPVHLRFKQARSKHHLSQWGTGETVFPATWQAQISVWIDAWGLPGRVA